MNRKEMNDEPDMHVLLCKVLFGEATEQEQRQVDARLAGSLELREAMAELEATARLVQSTMVESEEGAPVTDGISAARMEAVTAAARIGGGAPCATKESPRWYRLGAVRAAAAVAIATGAGMLALRGSDEPANGHSSDSALDPVGAATGFEPGQFEDDRLVLESLAFVDVTNGLEAMAARGLDPSGLGQPTMNAAGAPTAGYFYDNANYLGWNGSQSGTSRDAVGGFTLYSEALGVEPASVDGPVFGLELGIPHPERLSLQPFPNETPRNMFFRLWGDNPFVATRTHQLSTFAADVDTASFTLAKRMLDEGHLPVRAQIRSEEFVNFATPDLAPPEVDTFRIHGELAPSPFGGREDRYLVKVGVRAMDVEPFERPPLSLTFVVDNSGSMHTNGRLELVKAAMRMLALQLDGRDTIAIVSFADDARAVLAAMPATASQEIESALSAMVAKGNTNAEAGLAMGYQMAETNHREGAQSRVVFLSDGVANVGESDQDRIAEDVAQFAERDVFLNTIGVGLENHSDVFLEQLADRGDGVCDYVGDAGDAERAIVDRFVGGFVTVAKDVKIQVEFDPSVVLRWRQIGYENRALASRDFRNDAVDAGEVGAGHQVTCLYEVELASGDAVHRAPIATVRLRWKPVPVAGRAETPSSATERDAELRYGEIAAPSFRGASTGFRRAALAAQLAECLRGSFHARGDSVEDLGSMFAELGADDPSEDTATLVAMAERAVELGLAARPKPGPDTEDAERQRAYYGFLLRSLGEEADDLGTPSIEEYEKRALEILERAAQKEDD